MVVVFIIFKALYRKKKPKTIDIGTDTDTLHIHELRPVSCCCPLFFLHATRQPVTSSVRCWHNKHADVDAIESLCRLTRHFSTLHDTVAVQLVQQKYHISIPSPNWLIENLLQSRLRTGIVLFIRNNIMWLNAEYSFNTTNTAFWIALNIWSNGYIL